jgi:hypothetical protein
MASPFFMDKKYVYIITDGQFYKIGLSANPARRLRQLQTAVPRRLKLLAAYPATAKMAPKLEQQLHKMLWQRQARFRGEWFDFPSPDYLAFIDRWIQPYLLRD